MDFARQAVLPEVGPGGQERIASARVLVVGVGGLGCPAAQALAAAGIGHLSLVDPDAVEAANLHRQALYTPADVGRPKVEAAADRLRALAPALSVATDRETLDDANADRLVSGHDVVVDGTDRLPTRYVLDAACRRAGVPWVHAAVDRFAGQVATFAPDGLGYADLWPRPPATPPPSCAEQGVLGPVPAVLGAWQATEALLEILAVPRERALRVLDLLHGTADTVRLGGDGLHVDAPGEGAVWLDVRDDGEAGPAPPPGSLRIPVDALGARIAEVPRDRPVVCVCRTGHRATRAAMLLRRHGVDARVLRGGLEVMEPPLGGRPQP